MSDLESVHVQIEKEDREYLKMLSTTHGDFSHIIRAIIHEWVLDKKKLAQQPPNKREILKNASDKNRPPKTKVGRTNRTKGS